VQTTYNAKFKEFNIGMAIIACPRNT